MSVSTRTLRAFTEGIPGLKCSKGRKHNQGTAHLFFTGPRWIEYLLIDKGATISDTQQELTLQANKNAESAEVKKSAQKDSHRNLAKCVLDPNKGDAK
jgi:hypothetical protein